MKSLESSAEPLPEYGLYAIRYASRDAMRADNFMGGDPHDAPMPMNYFVWVAVHSTRTVLVDIGFSAQAATKRKRNFLCDPIDSLKLLGIDPDTIADVVITHLHYD
nr:MBL fold metallo-hydrolase [Pseudomonadota bacterium]